MPATDPGSQAQRNATLIILLPVFNDWEALGMLLPSIDRELQKHELTARVLVVDDASTISLRDPLCQGRLTAITTVEVLSLKRNLGHQRALAVGLSYIESNIECRAVVVMDADGEDAPQDIPRLYRKFEETGGQKVVFAERTVRTESWTFRFFYWLYRIVHVLLTGIAVRTGNYSLIPHPLLERLVVASELWNHYAAAIRKIRLPFEMLPTRRASRLAGSSQMNFVSLTIHGLRSMSVFGDRVGVRMLTTSTALIALTILSLGVAVLLRLGTNLEIPIWVTYTAGLFLATLMQILVTFLVFLFIILHSGGNIIPRRDHPYFLGECRVVYTAHEQVHVDCLPG